jgi:toxin ParE1/3/4
VSARRVIRRPAAKRDLIEHFVFLGEEAGLGAGERFMEAVKRSFERLRRTPAIGSPCEFLNPVWAELRRWPSIGFSDYPVFYRYRASDVEIVRVLHGSRDIAAMFENRD